MNTELIMMTELNNSNHQEFISVYEKLKSENNSHVTINIANQFFYIDPRDLAIDTSIHSISSLTNKILNFNCKKTIRGSLLLSDESISRFGELALNDLKNNTLLRSCIFSGKNKNRISFNEIFVSDVFPSNHSCYHKLMFISPISGIVFSLTEDPSSLFETTLNSILDEL